MYTNSGAHAGDVHILTKALGVGVITTAVKANMATAEEIDAAERSMMTLNRYARDIMVNFDVHAVTDVTGFSLMGHLLEMCQGADLAAEINVDGPEFLSPHVFELARLGILPAGMYRNRRYAEKYVEATGIARERVDVLFCPETSGGLLIAVAPKDADALLSALCADAQVSSARVVGRMTEYEEGTQDAKRIKLVQG